MKTKLWQSSKSNLQTYLNQGIRIDFHDEIENSMLEKNVVSNAGTREKFGKIK